jgi:hypothetical protein
VTSAEDHQTCSKLHSPAPKMRCGEVNTLEAPLEFPPPPQQAPLQPFPKPSPDLIPNLMRKPLLGALFSQT